MRDSIHSPEYRKLRAHLKKQWALINAPCGICGQATIDYTTRDQTPDSFELDHRISRKKANTIGRHDLDLDPNNMQPAHALCNRSKGRVLVASCGGR